MKNLKFVCDKKKTVFSIPINILINDLSFSPHTYFEWINQKKKKT
jgi:hypothetical protein